MSALAEKTTNAEQKADWRDKALKKKHAKLQQTRRENEELRKLLNNNGIAVPSVE
jgi:hypothetical protein